MQLAARGYQVFLPVYQKHAKWSDRTAQVDYPLFPGYCFCGFDSGRPSRIVSSPGVIRIVGYGTHPQPIPEHEIAAIQTMSRVGLRIEPHKYLRDGETIIITKGPLRGIGGFLVRNKDNMKVVVSIELLQRSVAVELDYGAVQKDSITEPF